MFAAIQQYVLYILGSIIALLIIAFTVQTLRIGSFKRDVELLNANLDKEKTINIANKGTLTQLKADSDALQARLNQAQVDILVSERNHSESLKRLLAKYPPPVDGKCEDMVLWAKDMITGRSQ